MVRFSLQKLYTSCTLGSSIGREKVTGTWVYSDETCRFGAFQTSSGDNAGLFGAASSEA